MFWSHWFETKPYREGFLPEKDGHQVYFAEFGNVKGKPLLITHGGPGGAFKSKYLKEYNLKKYRIIAFDQRGCGKSLPLGKLEFNTTFDTVEDMNRLLEYLNIQDKVILRGGSWASTLMLLFAERYSEKVEKMILSQIFLADKEYNQRWELTEVARFYPDFVEEMKKPVPEDKTLPKFYYELSLSDNPQDQLQTLNMYGAYERIMGALELPEKVTEINEVSLAYLRIYQQYAANGFYLSDGEILRNIERIENIPTVIVHNRLDFVCPLEQAWLLHKGMPQSKLVIVPDRGHCSDKLHETIARETKKFLQA